MQCKGLSKYSDDFNCWRGSDNLKLTVALVNNDLNAIWNWCKLWRITINFDKTKFLLFSNDTCQPLIQLNQQCTPLEQVTEKRMLGIIVDNKLSFKQHIDKITTNAKKSASVLSLFRYLSVQKLVTIYKVLVRPTLEFGSVLWGYKVNSSNNRTKLESAQRYSMLKILQAPPSTPTAVMEVELGIVPIDLRIRELERLEVNRILRKHNRNITNLCLLSSRNSKSNIFHLNNITTPLNEIFQSTYSTTSLEPEPPITIIDPLFNISVNSHNMNLEFGNSNNRTDAQKTNARILIHKQINSMKPTDLMLFCDGCSLGNPGPSGAAVVAATNEPNCIRTRTIGEAVSSCTDILHAELTAALLGSKHALKTITHETDSINFFIDSKSAIQTLTSYKVPDNYFTVIKAIKDTWNQIIESFDITINLFWVPGH